MHRAATRNRTDGCDTGGGRICRIAGELVFSGEFAMAKH